MNHEARRRYHVEFAELIDLRSIGGRKAIRMIRNPVDETNPGMLNAVVCVKQFRANDPNLRPVRRLDHRLEPVRCDLRVVVEKEHERSSSCLSAPCRGRQAWSETFIFGINDVAKHAPACWRCSFKNSVVPSVEALFTTMTS